MKPKTKIIEVKDKKYKLSKLDARTGSYVAFKLAAVIAPALKDNNVEQALSQVSKLPRAEFDEMQTLLLQTVTEVKDVNGEELPMPLMRNGAFIDDELNYRCDKLTCFAKQTSKDKELLKKYSTPQKVVVRKVHQPKKDNIFVESKTEEELNIEYFFDLLM